ncbi:MAG: CRISPR-associated endonuclease Cas2 [Candidatus Woesearchaeota archaeon]
MYIILIYDVNVKRVSKIMRICREYLEHIQNSVFEGEIRQSSLRDLKRRLKETMDEEEDSVIIYNLWNSNFKRDILGVEKNPMDNII